MVLKRRRERRKWRNRKTEKEEEEEEEEENQTPALHACRILIKKVCIRRKEGREGKGREERKHKHACNFINNSVKTTSGTAITSRY